MRLLFASLMCVWALQIWIPNFTVNIDHVLESIVHEMYTGLMENIRELSNMNHLIDYFLVSSLIVLN